MENKGTEDENGNQSEKDKSHKSPTMKQRQLNADQALVKLTLVLLSTIFISGNIAR